MPRLNPRYCSSECCYSGGRPVIICRFPWEKEDQEEKAYCLGCYEMELMIYDYQEAEEEFYMGCFGMDADQSNQYCIKNNVKHPPFIKEPTDTEYYYFHREKKEKL